MTDYEKFLLALVVLYLAAHAVARYGKAARIPRSTISLAESLVTL